MKTFASMIVATLLLLGSTQLQAQRLKRFKDRLENKVENRVNRKIDQKVDKVLDRAFEGNKNKDNQNERNSSSNEPDPQADRNRDFGDATVNHPQHNRLEVGKLGRVKVERSGRKHSIQGSWWTHEADIMDGFYIEIFDTDEIRSDKNPSKTTFKVPEEASMQIAYDFSLPVERGTLENTVPAVTDDYLKYDIGRGTVTITVLNDDKIKFSYSGSNGISGSVIAESPTFREQDEFRRRESSNNNNSGDMIPSFGGGGNGPDPAAEYNFTKEMVTKITQDGGETYEMSFFLNENEKYVGMGADMGKFSDGDVTGESVIVMDEGNVFIFVNSSGMRMMMTNKMDMGETNMNEQMEEFDYSQIRKTGATRRVMGYTCYEYQMQDDKMTVTLWAAPDFDLPNWFVQQGAAQTPIDGYIMAYTLEEPGNKVDYEVIDIKNINKQIVSSTYRKF